MQLPELPELQLPLAWILPKSKKHLTSTCGRRFDPRPASPVQEQEPGDQDQEAKLQERHVLRLFGHRLCIKAGDDEEEEAEEAEVSDGSPTNKAPSICRLMVLVCLSVCVCLSIYLSIYLYTCVYICAYNIQIRLIDNFMYICMIVCMIVCIYMFMLCYVMLCYVMLCYVMLSYVMLCYVMLCYVVLCYVANRLLLTACGQVYVARSSSLVPFPALTNYRGP